MANKENSSKHLAHQPAMDRREVSDLNWSKISSVEDVFEQFRLLSLP